MSLGTMPLYRSMKELRSYLFHIQTNLPKSLKHSVGIRLIDHTFNCISHISIISKTKGSAKVQMKYIVLLLSELDIIFDMVDFLVEEAIISYKQSAHIMLLMEDIEKQCGGLKKALVKESSQNSKG